MTGKPDESVALPTGCGALPLADFSRLPYLFIIELTLNNKREVCEMRRKKTGVIIEHHEIHRIERRAAAAPAAPRRRRRSVARRSSSMAW